MQTDILKKQLHKKRIVSGITPSGDSLHIGNYFGAVKPQIELQNHADYQTYYFVADVHALTTIKDKDKLEKNIRGVILAYLSLGLDPDKCTFFRQSYLSEHSELAVILANYISFGQMQRMHAFKDKLQTGVDPKSINMGLFNYPILMAADILLYKPFGVPVGEDQKQHVELARDIAENFNKVYGVDFFPLPKPLISQTTSRIAGTDGKRKMSKSLGNTIGIFDSLTMIEKKIAKIPTDNGRGQIKEEYFAVAKGGTTQNVVLEDNLVQGDFKKRYLNENEEEMFGVATLMEFVELFEGTNKRRAYEANYVGQGIRYGELKKELSQAIFRKFEFAQKKKLELEAKPDYIKQVLRAGAEAAQELAAQTLVEVKEIVGLKKT